MKNMKKVYLSIPIIANRNRNCKKIIAETIENEGYDFQIHNLKKV